MTAGRVIGGRYQVEGLLARGGTATVWLARDSRLERQVAIKELTGAWLAEPAALERFDREARIVARLNHPNIVAVHDVGIDDETPHLVMELVDGVTVAQMLRNGVLKVEQAVAIASQVCDGLSAAHAAGIIHRDVKPPNLMLTPAGMVKICDFGIARPIPGTEQDLTGSHALIGTTSYMAPEQVRREHVDARADLYGLGCTLYAMLTGVPPFAGGLSDVLRRHVDEKPGALREHRTDVPPALDALVAQLLAKAAADRPRDAAEVKTRLAGVMNDLSPQPTLVPALAPSQGGPVPLLAGRVRGRAPSVARAPAAEGPTVSSRARVRRTLLVGAAAIVVPAAIGTWALVTSLSTPKDAAVPSSVSTTVVDRATAAPAPGGPTVAANPQPVNTNGAAQSNVDTVTATPPPPVDPVAVMRIAIQDQVNTGNLNPDKASDLYRQVDLIAKAVSSGNPDEVSKNIKPMRDKLTALRAGGQLSASGYDTLSRALDEIGIAVA